jgi:hypothetical protein
MEAGKGGWPILSPFHPYLWMPCRFAAHGCGGLADLRNRRRTPGYFSGGIFFAPRISRRVPIFLLLFHLLSPIICYP